MKRTILICLVSLILKSCSLLFSECRGYNDCTEDGYREGATTPPFINEGSIVGKWEATYEWTYGSAEFGYQWSPIYFSNSILYSFFDDGTFALSDEISECIDGSGTYEIKDTQIELNYSCDSETTNLKTVLIDEFFFRKNYLVMINNNDENPVKKFEFIAE